MKENLVKTIVNHGNFLDFVKSDSLKNLEFVLGSSNEHEYQILDLAKCGNVIIGGTTGSGKSVFLHSVIVSFLLRKNDKPVKFAFIDPKAVEFHEYRNLTNLYAPIAKGMQEGVELLNSIKKLIIGREQINDIESNILVFVDEYADLVDLSPDVGKLVVELLKRGPKVGVHFFIATQIPRKDIYTKDLLQAANVKIAFMLFNKDEYKNMLGTSKVEELNRSGDMYVNVDGSIFPSHAFYVPYPEIKKILK